MDQSISRTTARLATIARHAMTARGLLPEFSPTVIAELNTMAHIDVERGFIDFGREGTE